MGYGQHGSVSGNLRAAPDDIDSDSADRNEAANHQRRVGSGQANDDDDHND